MIAGPQCLDPEQIADHLNRLDDNLRGIETNMRLLERAIIALQLKVKRPDGRKG